LELLLSVQNFVLHYIDTKKNSPQVVFAIPPAASLVDVYGGD